MWLLAAAPQCAKSVFFALFIVSAEAVSSLSRAPMGENSGNWGGRWGRVAQIPPFARRLGRFGGNSGSPFRDDKGRREGGQGTQQALDRALKLEGLQAVSSTQHIVGTQWSNRLRIVRHELLAKLQCK